MKAQRVTIYTAKIEGDRRERGIGYSKYIGTRGADIE